jgi:redox-sensitive bicupin YhaK (pirin superfamily)
MSEIRKIDKIMQNHPTIEGAGVHLKRMFGYHQVPDFDPFLLLDHFGSDNPADYMKGFPWHPHRGIETVTYMHSGEVEHGDSIGNSGVIKSGDVQWMTAGSGIIHQEMPKEHEGIMTGFQLWVNLPAKEKMMEPRYRDVKADTIPEVSIEPGIKIKVISGSVRGTKGPVQDIVVDIEYLDVNIEPDRNFHHLVSKGYNVFAYIIEGSGYFEPESDSPIGAENIVLYQDGDELKIGSGEKGVRFLLVSGKPLGEPVAWYGPIVMNTKEELESAFKELDEGTFIKHK